MARVELIGIEKRFDERSVVSGVSLDIADGEFIAILGPSGCGKSTLLRIIAGLEKANAGTVQIGGADATRLHPKDRNIAMVFQNYALYPHLSLYENIAFPLRVHRVASRKVDESVRRTADLVGIGHLLGRKPRQVSGGERQRAALARALVRDPALFLLDEPLSNLDAQLRQSAREELKSLQQRTGLTALYVTHDQVEAMGLGDRIVVMQAGHIRQIGTPDEIYRNPADTFVATFIGTPPMNLVEADGGLIGFRPESVVFDEANGRELAAIPVRVDRIEYLGNVRLVYAAPLAPFSAPRVIASLPFQALVPFREGENALLRVPFSELRYFDKATGLAKPDGVFPRDLPASVVGQRRG